VPEPLEAAAGGECRIRLAAKRGGSSAGLVLVPRCGSQRRACPGSCPVVRSRRAADRHLGRSHLSESERGARDPVSSRVHGCREGQRPAPGDEQVRRPDHELTCLRLGARHEHRRRFVPAVLPSANLTSTATRQLLERAEADGTTPSELSEKRCAGTSKQHRHRSTPAGVRGWSERSGSGAPLCCLRTPITPSSRDADRPVLAGLTADGPGRQLVPAGRARPLKPPLRRRPAAWPCPTCPVWSTAGRTGAVPLAPLRGYGPRDGSMEGAYRRARRGSCAFRLWRRRSQGLHDHG
jgi:hypothetical protein